MDECIVYKKYEDKNYFTFYNFIIKSSFWTGLLYNILKKAKLGQLVRSYGLWYLTHKNNC